MLAHRKVVSVAVCTVRNVAEIATVEIVGSSNDHRVACSAVSSAVLVPVVRNAVSVDAMKAARAASVALADEMTAAKSVANAVLDAAMRVVKAVANVLDGLVVVTVAVNAVAWNAVANAAANAAAGRVVVSAAVKFVAVNGQAVQLDRKAAAAGVLLMRAVKRSRKQSNRIRVSVLVGA